MVKLVDIMIRKALEDRASDIHIEPTQRQDWIIRYRIDGILYELPPPRRELHSAMVSRIKISCLKWISLKSVSPRTARSLSSTKGHKVDIRVSTMPIVFGEKVVMRILDKRMDLLDMTALGFEPEQTRAVRKGPECGPTGLFS